MLNHEWAKMNTDTDENAVQRNLETNDSGLAGKLLSTFGLMGLPTWLLLSAFVWLFRGFKAGGQQGGLSVIEGWICALIPTLTFAYYLLVSTAIWNSRWYVTGLVLNGLYLFTVATLVFATDGGFLVAPVMLIGPVLWFLHAVRMQLRSPKTTNSACDVGAPPTS